MLNWSRLFPPSALPTFSTSREWNSGNIGILSKFLGLDANFRRKIIILFDLAYASRHRLLLFISAGFFLLYSLDSWVPTVELIVEEASDIEEEDEANDNRLGLRRFRRRRNHQHRHREEEQQQEDSDEDDEDDAAEEEDSEWSL